MRDEKDVRQCIYTWAEHELTAVAGRGAVLVLENSRRPYQGAALHTRTKPREWSDTSRGAVTQLRDGTSFSRKDSRAGNDQLGAGARRNVFLSLEVNPNVEVRSPLPTRITHIK